MVKSCNISIASPHVMVFGLASRSVFCIFCRNFLCSLRGDHIGRCTKDGKFGPAFFFGDFFWIKFCTDLFFQFDFNEIYLFSGKIRKFSTSQN
jgi:hypothetical protein